MQDGLENQPTRKRIGIRLIYTVLFLIVFEILKTIVQLAVLFQFVYLLITKKYSNPVRNFSNKVAAYAYKVMRYLTLIDNRRPFPFSEFPAEIEPPEDTVEFK
jgi:hypothetical protein